MKPSSCQMCRRWEDDADLRIIEFEHSFAVLNRDQFFRGYTFLFTKNHVTELFHLEQQHRNSIMDEVSSVAAALSKAFSPAKINYELLGNMVPHIHWHLVPRFIDDALWPRPIWCEPHQEKHLTSEGYRQLIADIRNNLVRP